tara:strand:+ start:4865 stop:5236 length:372 start_codon:yes stop_codon:yes gene_type:complete
MKSTELKNLIKGAVREAIQEELKEILLEAVKTPRVSGTAAPSQVMESTMMGNPTSNVAQPINQTLTEQEKRDAYRNILGDMSSPLNTNNVPGGFQPPTSFDSANGKLPEGEVGMDQIMGLMKK